MLWRLKFYVFLKLYCLVLGMTLLLTQSGCGRIDENTGLVPGAMIYSAPLGLKRYDLETGEDRFILQLVDDGYAYTDGMAKVDNRHIIAAIPSPESSTDFHLYLVDIDKGTRKYLAPGNKPVYYPGGPRQGQLAYYSRDRDNSGIMLRSFKNGKLGKTAWVFDKEAKLIRGSKTLWKIDATTLAVLGQDRDYAYLIDIRNGEHRTKRLDGCFPFLWLPNRKKFICLSPEVKNRLLTRYNGQAPEEIVGMDRFSKPALYEPEIDTLFVTVASFHIKHGEIYGLGIYDFKSKKVIELSEKVSAFAHRMVWVAQ